MSSFDFEELKSEALREQNLQKIKKNIKHNFDNKKKNNVFSSEGNTKKIIIAMLVVFVTLIVFVISMR